jgi:peroxiredoxin
MKAIFVFDDASEVTFSDLKELRENLSNNQLTVTVNELYTNRLMDAKSVKITDDNDVLIKELIVENISQTLEYLQNITHIIVKYK